MNVATHTIISLFSGAGMLDAAVRCAVPGARTICFVEREAPAAAMLAARMADGSLCEAPIWSDIGTFDGRPWRGRVDGIIGGFPCTDLSVAGRQAGLDGDASGLFFEYVRIICEVKPRWVFIENVPPVLSFPTGGTVLGELAALGFDAEWGTVRASDVGAPHRRDRAFILAYSQGERMRGGSRDVCEAKRGPGSALLQRPDGSDCELAHAPHRGFGELREPSGRCGLADGCDTAVGYAADDHGRRGERGAEEGTRPGGERRRGSTESGEYLADTIDGQLPLPGRGPEERDGVGSAGAVCEFCGYPIGPAAGRYGCPNCEGEGLADSSGEGLPGSEQRESPGSVERREASGPTTEFRLPLFPPGPADADAWGRILADWPDLAPAVESELRGLADGAAFRVDRLRAGGNGVVVLQGAFAFKILAERARITV